MCSRFAIWTLQVLPCELWTKYFAKRGYTDVKEDQVETSSKDEKMMIG